jgi:hypothetical protein
MGNGMVAIMGWYITVMGMEFSALGRFAVYII